MAKKEEQMKHSREYNKTIKTWYDSPRWRVPRDKYKAKRIEIDGGMCELCRDELGYIVDHIKELNEHNFDDINVRLSEDNLQYICLKCHNQKTFKRQAALAEGYYINERGEVCPH